MEIVVLVLVAFAVVGVSMGVKAVPQGTEYTVERFGRYTRTLRPGLNVIIPVVDRVGRKINVMENVLDVEQQEAITKDNVVVIVDGVVFYQVMDAAKAAYQVTQMEYAIQNLVMTNIRSVIGAMDLDDILSNRDTINAKLLSVVDDATTPWGLKVTRIEIKDISPPRDIIEAMARQMKAERDKRAFILEADGQKEAAIRVADGQKQAAILEAEGRLEAAIRDAEARERLATAEAKATTVVSEAVRDGNPMALQYFVAQKYTEALQAIASADNQKVIMMPLEASSLIGSVAGIQELLKNGLGK
ncbi:MAG: paraslipin [Alphaproteobacteria bacterium CG_4_10_14_0_2_um_filter_63_37]|nr:MAG: paraslipin [Proteobacteria bacterium CG1_02_64_396]PJA25777.1 MAG: paraslipin [Alphaproteobacteria bacterium CG_4_10_14_0_2_um_filter_63_37]